MFLSEWFSRHKSPEQEYVPSDAEVVANATGWTKEKATEELAFAESLGIDSETYVKHGYWNVPHDQQEWTFVRCGRRRKIARQIAKDHGKDAVEIEKAMIEAKYKTGLRYEYFRNYDWDELTEDERKTIFLRPHGRQLSAKYRKPGAKSGILNKKERFYEMFPECIGRKWFLFQPDKTSYEDFCSKIEAFETEDVIYKPHELSGGTGIKKFGKSDSLREMYEEALQGGGALVEECITQHPDVDKLCPDSVNTIRLVTLTWDDIPTRVLYAGCRMGSGDGGPVDSVSQGGMSVGVDLVTGKIDTIGAAKDGSVYAAHPKTGTELVGYQLPLWDETLELVKANAGRAFTEIGLGYVGWDIAITPDAPIVIEANNWPSPSLVQLPWFKHARRGLLPLVQEYL